MVHFVNVPPETRILKTCSQSLVLLAGGGTWWEEIRVSPPFQGTNEADSNIHLTGVLPTTERGSLSVMPSLHCGLLGMGSKAARVKGPRTRLPKR